MIKGSRFLLLLALAVVNVPGLAQEADSHPIDPGAAVAMGNSVTAQTLDHCDPGKKRALVLSGGGLKGAFEAGAVYHFIVHRSCDFNEIAGVSVGSLNAVILAQAQRDDNPEASLKNMAGRAEKLVEVWKSIRSPKQILKPRWPGWTWALALRYGLFGTESMNTFDPLMHLIQTNVDMDALDRGRPVRVGSVSLWDGTYREVGPSATFPNNDRKIFLQYVYASALIPIVGKLPRIQQSAQDTDAKQWIQYGDGGILNNTPIFNYFRKCQPQVLPFLAAARHAASAKSAATVRGRYLALHEECRSLPDGIETG
jgi:predicted acylesterase/phospholipase RssA